MKKKDYKVWTLYTRRCKKCDVLYKTYSKRSKICPECKPDTFSMHTRKKTYMKYNALNEYNQIINEIKKYNKGEEIQW